MTGTAKNVPMIDLLQYEFMRNALWAALLTGVLCGVLGTVVVVKRYVILAGGVAHGAYGGVGLALFLGISPGVGALGFSVTSALLMAWVMLRKPSRADTIIGVLWATGMAAGILFADLTPGYGADLMSYLFGSILTVSREDLLLMEGLLAVMAVGGIPWHRELSAFSYDEDFARTRGIPVTALHFALVAVLAVAVVLIIRVIGLILVMALFTIPPSIAEKFRSSLWGVMGVSCLLSTAFSLSGLALAVAFDITAGAAIVLVAAAGYALSLILPDNSC